MKKQNIIHNKASISHNEETANISQTLLWLVFSSLSTLLYPVLIGIGISKPYLLLKYLVAVSTIIGFDLFVFFLSSYLSKLLAVDNKNQTKKEFFLKSLVILISGATLIFALVFLKAVSNNTNAFIFILSFLPLEIYKNTKKLNQSKLALIKITKIILLLIYSIVFFKISVSTPLLITFLAWISLFLGKYISEALNKSEENNNKTFKLCIFSLISSPLLFGLLVVMEALPKIFTIVNISVFFIVYLLNKNEILTNSKLFRKNVEYFVFIQITLIAVTSMLEY